MPDANGGDETDDRLDGTYTAVLDRYEDDVAVLVVEHEGQDIAERLVGRAALPDDAQAVDTVLEVRFVDDDPVEIEPKPDETAERSESAQSRFDRMSRRRRSDDTE